MAKLTTELQVAVLALFDQATERQRKREACRSAEPPAVDRGWKREDLYDRARPR